MKELQRLEVESKINAQKEHSDYIETKNSAKFAEKKRYELEKEIYTLQNMLETLRKNR